MDPELVYKIALSLTPGISAEVVRNLADLGISTHEFFTLNMPELNQKLRSMACRLFQNIAREEALFRARQEFEFVQRHKIKVLFILDDDFPMLLRDLPDAPIVLYQLGNTNLDTHPSLSIVGTRRSTSYGLSFTDRFVESVAPYYPDAMIVSGLAYGIDTAAHVAALKHGLPTVAVMAHGLDTIYPAQNRDLAKQILAHGGSILSEYPTKTRPYRQNFLQRNRIVAGLSELTFVVESEIKGGAMSTASIAFSYGRDVMALPGRFNDPISAGCNHLIAKEKARIYTSLPDLMNLMRWKIPALDALPPQKVLFPELEGDLATVYQTLRQTAQPMSIDSIHLNTGLSMPLLIAALTELEFEGIINKLPGARYELS